MGTAVILRELVLVAEHALLPGRVVADVADHLHGDLQVLCDRACVLPEESAVLLRDRRHDVRRQRPRSREERLVPGYSLRGHSESTDRQTHLHDRTHQLPSKVADHARRHTDRAAPTSHNSPGPPAATAANLRPARSAPAAPC